MYLNHLELTMVRGTRKINHTEMMHETGTETTRGRMIVATNRDPQNDMTDGESEADQERGHTETAIAIATGMAETAVKTQTAMAEGNEKEAGTATPKA